MLGQIDSNKTYLYIIGGNITQKVDKDAKGAKVRKNKKDIEVWEKSYRYVDGKITRLHIESTDFGKYLEIDMSDGEENYSLSLACESSYFSNFIDKMDNIDFQFEVKLAPYNLKDKTGKTRSGVSVYQNGDKLDYAIGKDNRPEGYPVCPEGCTTGDANQKMFFIQKTEWEINYVSNKTFNFFKPEIKEPVPDNSNIEFQDFDQNTLGDDEVPF